jgi:hypothetical protein
MDRRLQNAPTTEVTQMGKRMKSLVAWMTAVGGTALVGCGAGPEDDGSWLPEPTQSEEVGESSGALPCQDCGGGEGYNPPEYYPYDDECGTGETRWNSANGCGPGDVCRVGLTGCKPPVASVRRCGTSGCGPTNGSSTNPCYNGYSGMPCTLSGGYTGHCGYDFAGQLACFSG